MWSLWNVLLVIASFGCCGTITALMLIESRRRRAQRYALIGQATEDFDEDFVDVEARGEEAEDDDDDDDDDDDGLDLPQLSPPPALQSPHPTLLSPQPVATPVTPAVAALQPDLLDFTLPPTPSAITPVVTTSENWVAEMESEIQEFDQLTAQHGMPPNSAPGGAGWKQSMEEELELHLAKT